MNREERNKFNYERTHKIIDDILHKWCNKCEKWILMNEDYWYLWDRSKDGFASQCKICIRMSRSKYQADNWDKCYTVQRKWVKDNRDYVNQRFEKWEALHPEREEYKSKYQQSNPDKMQEYGKKRAKKNHIMTDDEWIACKDYFKNEDGEWSCAYCGKPISKNIKKYKGVLKQYDLEKEHVIDDGRNDIKNCIPSCNTCNSKKKRRTLNEFYNPKNKNYTYERYHKIYMWIRYDYKKYIQKKKPKRKYNRKQK